MTKPRTDRSGRNPEVRTKSHGLERETRAAADSAQAMRRSSARPSNRAERAADRRQAIIDAAFDEFIDRGYAATRLDDVASRAGVAKGTIYLHFKDKQALFEELVRTALVPLIGRLSRALERALSRNVKPAIYTEDMFKTTHDAANREAVRAVIRAELNLVGLAMRAERKVIDKILDGLKFYG